MTHTAGIREEQWKDGIIEFDRFEHDQEDVVTTAFGPMVAPPGEKIRLQQRGIPAARHLLGSLFRVTSIPTGRKMRCSCTRTIRPWHS